MRNSIRILFVSVLILLISIMSISTVQAEKKKKNSAEEEQKKLEEELKKSLEEIGPELSALTKKVYASTLFSPSDNDKMVDIKLKLMKLYDENPNVKLLASPMYDIGYIHKSREYFDDAEELFNIVIEKYPDTTYSQKAKKELTKLEDLKQKQMKKAESGASNKKKG